MFQIGCISIQVEIPHLGNFLLKELASPGEALTLFSDERRSFTSIALLARTVLLLIREHPQRKVRDTFLCVGSQSHSRMELGEMVKEIVTVIGEP